MVILLSSRYAAKADKRFKNQIVATAKHKKQIKFLQFVVLLGLLCTTFLKKTRGVSR